MTGFEILGDPDAAACEGGVCAVPGPRPDETERGPDDQLSERESPSPRPSAAATRTS